MAPLFSGEVRQPLAVNLDNPKGVGNTANKRSYAVELPESPGPGNALSNIVKKTHNTSAVTTSSHHLKSRESNTKMSGDGNNLYTI